MGTLFDPDDYLRPGAEPRKPRTTRVVVRADTFEIRASRTWCYVSRRTPGIVHAHRGYVYGDPASAYATWCGLYAAPMSYPPGQLVVGCAKCRDAMAAFGGAQ